MAGVVDLEAIDVAGARVMNEEVGRWVSEFDAAPEGLQETIDALLVLMPILVRRIAGLAADCPLDYKPTIPQVRVMTFISTHGTATVSQIAEALELSRPAASELVDRMVEIGYVTRTSNPADRRQVLISLTSPAAVIVDGIVAQRRALFLDSLVGLTSEELAGFLKGMRGFARTLAPDILFNPSVAPVCAADDSAGKGAGTDTSDLF